jgi:hypothetical protein
MGATIAKYPRDWAACVEPLRKIIGDDADVLFGIGVNFTGISKSQTSTNMPFFFGFFGAQNTEPPSDPQGIKSLVEDKLDFIGVSAYAPGTGPGFPINEIENAAFNIKVRGGRAERWACGVCFVAGQPRSGLFRPTTPNCPCPSCAPCANHNTLHQQNKTTIKTTIRQEDLSNLGIDLLGLINSGRLELHYSEFGVGGAGRDTGRPAPTVEEVARFPFAGVDGLYTAANDPWRRPYLKEYALEFYQKVAKWLENPDIKTHRVSKVYIWCHASFDILGVVRCYGFVVIVIL